MPVKVDIQYIEEVIPPFLVSVATYRIQETSDLDIASNDGVHRPFGPKESYAVHGLAENVRTEDENSASIRCETLSGQYLEEGRLPG